MIENNAHELNGQTELTDFIDIGSGGVHAATEPPEGYDAEGRLLNEDYPPAGGNGGAVDGAATMSAPVGAASTPPSTESPVGAALRRPPEEPHTSAPAADRLTVLAGEIHAITEHARVVLASAAIDIGKRLIEAQTLVPEGRWGEWLEKNVDYSQRQAQVMMQLADQFGRGELPDAFRGLGISHMTALLAAPAEEREDFAQRVQDEGLSVRELKKEIEALKIEKAKGQMRIDALTDQYETAKRNIKELDEEGQKQDRAIVERDRAISEFMSQMDEYDATIEKQEDQLKAAAAAIEREREAARLAQAKAAAAEASAEELRRLHSDAEDRAAASAQRASDAVNRANQTAKDLSAARAQIAKLEAEKAAMPEPEPRTVEVVPESVTRELEALRAQLAEAQAKAAPTVVQAPEGPTASDRFKWFYSNQMKPAFSTALNLLREVAREDAHAADLFATALTKGCQQLMNQLGTKEG